MTNRQIISIIILLLCAVAFYIMPMQIDDGEVGAFVGASLMPTLAVSLIVVFVSFDLILSVFLNDMSKTGDKAGQGDVLFESSQISSIVIVIGLLSLFGMFLIPAGYVLASTALLAGLMFFGLVLESTLMPFPLCRDRGHGNGHIDCRYIFRSRSRTFACDCFWCGRWYIYGRNSRAACCYGNRAPFPNYIWYAADYRDCVSYWYL
jgi:hypothetical protein